MIATVLINVTETKSLTMRTGVRQGCVIVPTLFLVRDRLSRLVEID